MQKVLWAVVISISTYTQAQDFAGYRTGNYTGVNGTFFNPAHIADSRYRYDFNLFSLSTSVGNNRASFNIKNVVKAFDVDSLQEQVLGKDAGPSSGIVSVAVHGPSLMFNAGKKGAVALTTRARSIVNVIDLDGKLVKELSDDLNDNTQLPYTLSQDMRMGVNAWTEFGLSYGRVIADKDIHFVKGGLTLKYLAGVANGFLNIAPKGTLNEDVNGVYLANATGRLAAGFGGVRISDFEAGNFTKLQSTGFGTDLGFVYEYRPQYEQYKQDTETEAWRRDRNKYKVKIGVAVLDIGKIKYDRDVQRSGAYDLSITGNERFYLSELDDVEIDDYNAFFRSRPQYFTPVAGSTDATYNVSLPTALQLNVDYHLRRGLYVSLEKQLPLTTGRKNAYNPRYYSSFTLAPRYEGRGIGLYVPINYNALTGFNIGTGLSLGPLFVGSGSAFTALFGNSKQADVYIGFRFGGLQKDMLKKQRKEEVKEDKKERKRLEKDKEKAQKKTEPHQ